MAKFNSLKKNTFKKILRIIGITLGSIILALILFTLSLRLGFMQNFLKDRAITYLEEKIKTPVSLEKIYIGFPNSVELKKLYLAGQKIDTLLYAGSLEVKLNLWELMHSRADITSIKLEDVNTHVVRNEDGTFNYDYIVEAFATNEKEEKKESKPFEFSLDKIDLKNIRLKYIDLQAKNHLNVKFHHFNTRVQKFDLENNDYAIGNILLDGLKLHLKQDIIEEVAENVQEEVNTLNSKKPIQLALKGIELKNFDVWMEDDQAKTYARVIFQELSTKVNRLNLTENKYDIQHLKLRKANIDTRLWLSTTESGGTKNTQTAQEKSAPFLKLKALHLDDVQLKYANTAAAPIARGMDFNHLNFRKLNLKLNHFQMENGTFTGVIHSAEIQENKGLNIQKLQTEFAYKNKEAYLKNLLLQTPYTLLRDEIKLSYESISQLSHDLGNVHFAAHIPNSKIGFKDILLLAPTLRNTAPFNTYPTAILSLNTKVIGKINDLAINDLQASGMGDLRLSLSGRIKNATLPEALSYDLRIKNFSSSAKTLRTILPPNTLPKNISLPERFSLSGNAKGTTNQVLALLELKSTEGDARLMAQVDMRDKNAEIYSVKADLYQMNIGKIIQNKDLGIITAQLKAKGRSFDVSNGNTIVEGKIDALDYNQYRYQNILLHGTMNRGVYTLEVDSKDPNAQLQLSANGVYNEEKPSVELQAAIEKLDFHRLNFSKESLAIAGQVQGNFDHLDPDMLNGTLSLNQFAISDGQEVFPLQPVEITAVSTNEHNQLMLRSQLADVDLNGRYKITQIFTALQHTLNQYYQFQKKSSLPTVHPGQYFTLDAKIKDDDLIRKFVPELNSFQTLHLTGNYQTDTQSIKLHANIPQLDYDKNKIEQGKLSIFNQNEALHYALQIEKISTEQITLNTVDFSGNIFNNTITYLLRTQDEKGIEQFLVAGKAHNTGNATQVSLDSNGLRLNYDLWSVDPENRLQFGKGGIVAENFHLAHQESKISLQSETTQPSSPLNISIRDFKIQSITEMLKKDTLLAKGNINGDVTLSDLQKDMRFDAVIQISELEMYETPIGTLDLKANTQANKRIATQIQLSGNENSMDITGSLHPSNKDLDFNVNIGQLQMKSVQGLSANAIEDAEGFISGNLSIKGKTDAPQVIGKLTFNDVAMLVAKTGSHFRNINDDILFQADGIHFNQFELKDAQGNALTINGKVLTKTYQDFGFDLKITADDFKAVDAEEDFEKLMYGTLAIDANLNVRGNLDLPKVDGTLSVTERTDFTFVLPQSSPSLADREGIVEFIDQDQIALNETLVTEIDTDTELKGMNVNVNISINKEAKISILIDKSNGDFVKLQGEAELTGGLDPSGKTTLVGVYEVEEGAYEMSLSMLKRRFEIEKGSTITWTGEPTTAQLDLTAIYTTRAAPLDLLQQQLTTEQMNYYKQRIPFNTELILTGELLKPVINFDITVDDEVSTISREVLDNTQTKLEQLRRDEAEMNKQVFALLSLNRFVGENPFQSDSGQSANTMLKQSVSQILSQQLNHLAEDLIAGVDLSFDLDSYEDYSTGTKNNRTDLNVNLSKNLLNDRLKVTVGSNFGVEGSARQNEQMTNIAGNIRLDYLVSKDGRYKLRAYRKNDYQVALQGQIIETGAGFVLTLDYDKFKHILLQNKYRKEVKRAEKNTTKNE